MEQVQIGNITYLLDRHFAESKTPADLIGERLKSENCQALPLTMPAPVLYNTDGN